MPKNKIQGENVQEAKRLININEDSRQYFYEKANETWLMWLWKNGFFDVLKKKAEEPSRFSYKTPELRYLVRMAEIIPETVIEIMLDIPISEETFNPEVIDQFLRICRGLPGEQIAKLVGKIKTENWPALMQMYNQWGMDYGKMFERLEKSGHYIEMMVLASAVLGLRDDWEARANDNYSNATPFCLSNLSFSKVFFYLSKIDENYIDDAIDLSLSIIKKMTTLSEQDRETASVFRQKDSYPLYDVDIFEIGVRSEYRSSGREDVREVVALIKTLTERVLLQQSKEKAKFIFEKIFESLPDSWLMWRIRLFVLSLCPSELMLKLKESLYRIFKEDRYPELIMGAEYKKALMKAFPLMDIDDQSKFISMTKEFFSHASDDEISSKKRDGSQIFSVIGEYLSEEQIAELIDAGFEVNQGYVPSPMFGMGKAGFVNAKGPVSQEEYRSITVSTIVDNLKGIWSPSQLIEQDVQRDFLNPLNAEGMGKLLKEDVRTRLGEYLEHANEFLDPENVDLHYLYSLLSGFADAIERNTKPLERADWELLVDFCLQIIASSKEQPVKQLEYESNIYNAWLARWNAVHSEMIKMLRRVLGGNGKKLGFEWNLHRQDVLSVIVYLFDHPDPMPDDEQFDSAKMTESIAGQLPLVSDPFLLAINSIRGQAFELFVLAVELDTEKDEVFESIGLSTDLKKLYEYLLTKEDTRAIMFMFGHYLPMLFFRDKNWLKSILNKIFPTDKGKKYLYLAAWEGYLTNNLYIELFKDEEFQKLYKRAIVMTEKEYPHQRHFKDPDEGIAQHFALAYMVSDFEFGNALFDYFLTDGGIGQHIEFVDRLGRSFISSQNPEALNFLRGNENAGRKLKDMWNWLLDNCTDPSVFNGIGFWINLDKGIFQANELANYLAKTITKTDGYLRWDIGLLENIVALAQDSPEDTVEITRLFLLEGSVRNEKNSLLFVLDEKWIEAFGILYTHPATKQATLSLINDLIHEGGNLFWPLKGVLEST